MELFIIRHAWAEPMGDPAWPSDAQRPLTPEGRKRFARMAEMLVSRGVTPDLIATSPLVRCLQTAEVLAGAVGPRSEVVLCEYLRPGGDPTGLLDWTARQQDEYEQIAWVGHAPDVNHLAAGMIGASGGQIHFGKGAIACVRLDDPIRSGLGELRWLLAAKMLGW
ncbi:MAG: phosphohistidine phosphatase SixA [Thermoguttaceae bacterium]|jgi:phosphohistidine phosphatase